MPEEELMTDQQPVQQESVDHGPTKPRTVLRTIKLLYVNSEEVACCPGWHAALQLVLHPVVQSAVAATRKNLGLISHTQAAGAGCLC